uniref:BCAR1 scaffold protein, Cas family member n=1 Tax=Bubo bubo TaxID=30461 RepID=A0A8C0FGI2_BUBBB
REPATIILSPAWGPCPGQPNGCIPDTGLLPALPLPWHVILGKSSEELSASPFPGRLFSRPWEAAGEGRGCQIMAGAPKRGPLPPTLIYDVPPVRGGVPSQFSQEVRLAGHAVGLGAASGTSVLPSWSLGTHTIPDTLSCVPPLQVYDTPPMAVKGPNGQDPGQEIYDVPPSVEKNLHQTVSAAGNKDVPDGPAREETYDVPPAFAKQKTFDPSRHPLILAQQEPYLPEDVYDVPPAAGKGAPEPPLSHEIYDVPPSLKKLGGSAFPSQEVYDVPRDLHAPGKGSLDTEGEYIYDVPPQVDREAKGADAKRLSASSTGSTRSNISTSSLDVVPVKEPAKGTGKEFSLDLDAAMETLAKLQHGVGGAVSYLMGAAPTGGFCAGGSLTQEHWTALTGGASATHILLLLSGLKMGVTRDAGVADPRVMPLPSLQGKEEFEKTQKELLEKGNIIRQSKDQLEHQQLKQFERLEQEVTRPIDNDLSNWSPPQHYGPARGGGALCPADRQLLLFYLEQCEANLTTLTNAVDAFFTAVSTNQPPKIFVAHSKFVILSAHKLVFIGDTLSRQAKAQDVQHKVMHYSNLLCEMLKEIVVTTKAAALHYPSPAASKDMVERVKDLANSTQQFRMVLGQLAAM